MQKDCLKRSPVAVFKTTPVELITSIVTVPGVLAAAATG